MRLVFTKLETPKKNILVDLGTGEFEEFSLQELEDSETGKYLQIPDTIPANSIRVKVNSSEFGSFDMIKEYQITDDEGNILGGSGSGSSEIDIKEVEFMLQGGCGGYNLVRLYNGNYQATGFIDKYESDLHYLVSMPGVGTNYYQIGQYVAEQVARAADGTILYLKASAYTGYGYTPVPYRIKIRG
jgi:hypothetical protein